jgi:hypothetical protein
MVFKITGQVRESERKIGVSNLVVRAFDNDLIYDDLLGSVTTDENGCFEITYEETDYKELFDKQPDIYLTLRSPDYRRVVHTTEDKVRFEADKEEHFIIDIPRKILGDLAPPIPKERRYMMGTAKLNIWIRDKRCCKVLKYDAHLHVYNCCGEQVMGVFVPSGHVEVDIPPGCYYVRAGVYTGHGNVYTDHAFVIASCEDKVCVNLILPRFVPGTVPRVTADLGRPLLIGGGCVPPTILAAGIEGLNRNFAHDEIAGTLHGLMKIAKVDKNQMATEIEAEITDVTQNLDEITGENQEAAKKYLGNLKQLKDIIGGDDC